MQSAKEFINRFSRWAETRIDIRGALLVGSYASGSADPYSDLDLLFITRRANDYSDPQNWLPELGEPWVGFYSPNDPMAGLSPGRSMFAVFEDGLVVDFMILPLWETRLYLWGSRINFLRRVINGYDQEARFAANLLRSGTEILYDPDGTVSGIERTLLHLPDPEILQPTQIQFDQALHDFWYGPASIVNYLQRGQWFKVRREIDQPGKRLLLQMAEWHARSQANWDDPPLLRHKDFEEWAAPYVVEKLPQIFGCYSEDLWHSLLALNDCFHQLSRETASRLELAYPTLPVDKILAWTQTRYQAYLDGKG
jgi:predicted nucleotidyltransferase